MQTSKSALRLLIAAFSLCTLGFVLGGMASHSTGTRAALLVFAGILIAVISVLAVQLHKTSASPK